MSKRSERKTEAPAAADVRDIPTGMLVESPWNTHGKVEDADMDGLVESMRRIGLVQRLVVRPIDAHKGEGRFEIVDGHRRFWAAKIAGMESLPCEVRSLSDEEAQRQTLAANIQRLENSPMLEAGLIGRMRAAGQTVRVIAAALGRTEAYVVRRSRLMSLAPCWRMFAEKVPCTTDLLEHVASHEVGLQERVAAEVDLDGYEYDPEDHPAPYGWDEFDDAFRRSMRTLDEDTPFDIDPCARCPNNTANHQFLFPDMECGEGERGRCQDPACWTRKCNEAVDAELERLRKRGIVPKTVRDRWYVPNHWDSVPKADSRHPVPYTWEADGVRHLVWGVPKDADASSGAMVTPEQRAAEKERRRRDKLVRGARNKMRERIAEMTEDVDQFKSNAGIAYDELAARRLDRELRHMWPSDDFVDDFAALFPEAFDKLTEEEAEAYGEQRRHDESVEAGFSDDDDGDGGEEGEV